MNASVSVKTNATPDRPIAAVLGVLAVYLVTLGSMATVGVVVPQIAELSNSLGASAAQIGLAIGLYSLPAALCSIPLGVLVDRLGAKCALLLAAFVAILADGMIFRGDTLLLLQLGMAIAGIANAMIITSAPALLMASLSGSLQVRAVSLWSTYGPAGYALGLLIGAPFAGGTGWRTAMLCMIALITTATAVLALAVPPARHASKIAQPARFREIIALLANREILRISATYGIIAGLSYGSGLAAPGFLVATYGVSMTASATAIATAKIIAMLLGGVGMGWLLKKDRGGRLMFAGICLFGFCAQTALFFPASGVFLATGAMILWLFAYGALSATSFVTLARLNRDRAQAGLASGLIGQLSAVACFAAPAIYFAIEAWTAYVTVAGLGLALAAMLFPSPITQDRR